MTSSVIFGAPAPSHRGGSIRSMDVLLVCMAALPLGLVIDRWFGLLPALTARCGGFESPLGMLEWHWACMPATSLMMLCAAPAWIGLRALARSRRSGAGRPHRPTGALAACACHLAMLIGIASALCAGPELAALAGLPWTGGAAIAAMAFGMVSGMGASACGGLLASAFPLSLFCD